MSSINRKRVISAKTADYTVAFPGDNSKLFTNTGASGAVTFTLPAASAALVGSWVEVLVTADQTVTVATATTDTLICANDIAADSIAWDQANEKIGNGGTLICVESGKWALKQNAAIATTTPLTQTIATA